MLLQIGLSHKSKIENKQKLRSPRILNPYRLRVNDEDDALALEEAKLCSVLFASYFITDFGIAM